MGIPLPPCHNIPYSLAPLHTGYINICGLLCQQMLEKLLQFQLRLNAFRVLLTHTHTHSQTPCPLHLL